MMTPWTSRGLINWLYELINHVTMTLPGRTSWGQKESKVTDGKGETGINLMEKRQGKVAPE